MQKVLSVDAQLINVGDAGDIATISDFPYGMALITSYLRSLKF